MTRAMSRPRSRRGCAGATPGRIAAMARAAVTIRDFTSWRLPDPKSDVKIIGPGTIERSGLGRRVGPGPLSRLEDASRGTALQAGPRTFGSRGEVAVS